MSTSWWKDTQNTLCLYSRILLSAKNGRKCWCTGMPWKHLDTLAQTHDLAFDLFSLRMLSAQIRILALHSQPHRSEPLRPALAWHTSIHTSLLVRGPTRLSWFWCFNLTVTSWHPRIVVFRKGRKIFALVNRDSSISNGPRAVLPISASVSRLPKYLRGLTFIFRFFRSES